MWILIVILFALCVYKILDATREVQELRRETQRLQEDAGRRQTHAQEDHRKMQALEDNAKELQDGLEAVSSRSKEKDATIASLEERLTALNEEKKSLVKAKDQALLDAKRALSSISGSGKGAKDAIRQKEMAEEDRNVAYKQMEEAQEAAARAEAAAAEAIQDRDRVLALKASVDAQAAENERIRADLHAAHEAQTKAEAERFTAQQAAAAAAAECTVAQAAQATAEAARDAAEQANYKAQETLNAASDELETKHTALIEAIKRAETAEAAVTARQNEVAIWKQRAMETEKGLVAEQDKLISTQKQFTSMKEKFTEVFAGNTAMLEQISILEKQVEISENEADNLRNQLENELKKSEEAQNKIENALKVQQRLENELAAAQEAAVQSAEEEILAVRRELESKVAESDGEIQGLKAQLEAATSAADARADENVEQRKAVEAELEKMKELFEKSIQEQDILQATVSIAENKLEKTLVELEETRQAQINAVDVAKDELLLEISRNEEAEKKLESLKIDLEMAINARDRAEAEAKDLQKAVHAAAEVKVDAGLVKELAALKKKNDEHELQIAALLDAKASLSIELEDEIEKKEKLQDLNRLLLLREKEKKISSGSANAVVEEGLQSPAVKKASSDMAEKLETLKKSTEKLQARSSPAAGIKTVPGTTPPSRLGPQSPLSSMTKTP